MTVINNWTVDKVMALYDLPFNELIFQAQTTHRKYFPEAKMQLSTLLNIKDGGCPEDCHYCPQAARYHTGVKAKKLLDVNTVRTHAISAKKGRSNTFLYGCRMA